MKKTFRKVVTAVATVAMAFTLAAGLVPSAASAGVDCSKAGKKAGKAEFDPAGTYHAYFLFQQSESWVFRNAWYDPELGKDGKFKGEGASYDAMLTSLEVADPVAVGGTVIDAEITGNGTYTVGVTGFDVTKLDQDSTKTTLIGVSTDLPSSGLGTFTISDVKLKIDGSEKWAGDPYVNKDAEEHGLYHFDIVNTYQNAGYESPTIMNPNDSIEITFTVSGFSSDNPDAVEGGDDAATGDDAGTGNAGTTGTEATSSGSATPIVIVIIALIVIVVIVVVVKKKKS